ncbi:MAG: hypothetical protein JRF18_07345 [Deltaproteobacteria bacterium]|nr:hypothetical protein [Deltaproteobacteria bacterium]
MKPMNLYSILLILFLLYPTSAIAQSKSRVKGTMPKSTMKATAKPDQLPELRCSGGASLSGCYGVYLFGAHGFSVIFSYTLGNYQWAQYNFTAVADSTNHITEFNEANNEKYGRDEVADALRQ